MSNEENISADCAVHNQSVDLPRMFESESVTVPSEYLEKVENIRLSCPEEKAALGQIRHEHIQRTDPFDRLTQAQSTEHKETGKNCFDKNKDFCQPESHLPPLEDPSVILLSPTPIRKSMSAKLLASPNSDKSYEDDYTDLESLAEEVHHVKEDKARVFINSKLKDSISDMVAYQKHIDEEQRPKTHFELLKESQMKAQKEFHARLFQELAAENQQGKKSSKVAEALGTKFSAKTQENVSIYDQEHSGFKSAPSKSPNMSRRGSNAMDTWMSKSPFWSQSLPRPRRKVTFVDDSPQRPPPPPPERQQSINTMRSMSGISTVYNQTLIEESNSQAHYYQPGSDSGHQKISSGHQQTGLEHQQTGSGHQQTGSGHQQTGSGNQQTELGNQQKKSWNQQTSCRTQETSSGSVQFENTIGIGNQNLEQEIHRQELKREELKLQEFQRQESERQELEKKELERKALERKELKRKEMERKEFERQEKNRQELQKQELQKQEMQKQELHKKELQKLELIKQEQEFKKQELQKQDLQKQQQFSHFDQTQSQQKHQYQIQSQQEHQHQNQSQKEHQYQNKSQQEHQYQTQSQQEHQYQNQSQQKHQYQNQSQQEHQHHNQSQQQHQYQNKSQQEHQYPNQSQQEHQYQNQSQQEHQHQYQNQQYNQQKSHSPRQIQQFVEKNDGNALKSVEYREFYKGRIERRTPEQEYKLDLGSYT